MSKLNKLKYTLKHKCYFLKIEYKLTGKISLAGIIHDMDKVFMYMFSSKSVEEIQEIHRSKRKHHVNNLKKTEKDYTQMIIDWECARFSKPDKPLNARQTLEKYYSALNNDILPLLDKLKL